MSLFTQRLAVAGVALLLVAGLLTGVSARAQGTEPTINEIRTDQVGTDDDEYFELAAPAATSLDGLTYLVIGDGTGGSGVVETVLQLTGQTVPFDGFFVVAENSFTLGTADLSANINFENSDNVTHLLVEGFAGALFDDLDTNDDGVLDSTPWTAELDRIALIEEENPPSGPGTEYHYGPPTVGPDGSSVPGHVYRCPDMTGGFQIGPLDPVGANDTPGAANTCGGGEGDFTVNSTADPGDGVCNATECTLREAVDLANTDAAQDTITFDIPGVGPHSIQLQSGLATIGHPVVIDATSEPDWAAGAPVVELDGTNATGATGLTLAAPSTVRGLVINRFDGDGLLLGIGSDGSTIEGNFIGTDVNGTTALGNDKEGIDVRSADNTIGGDTIAERNLVGGNAGNGGDAGVLVLNASGNIVKGNLIGIGADGVTDVGNAGRGLWLSNAGATTVGGPGAPNVISGNNLQGIFVQPNLEGTVIQGNRIGTNEAGTGAVPNGLAGIEFVGAPDPPAPPQIVTVGGRPDEDEGNLISGNTGDGLLIATNLDATVQGNRIGTDADGIAAVPNGGDGIVSSSPALIGSVDGLAAGGNVISGNVGHGIDLPQSAAGAVVQGNMIGTTVGGSSAIGNGGDGIFHHGPTIVPSTTLIGGGPGFVSNVVSGNTGAGIRIDGLFGVTIHNNRIGTNAAGTSALPNGVGVVLDTDQATLGGTGADNGNLISGNTNEGVTIEEDADGNLIQGNRIGVAPNGVTPVANGSHGVLITGADGNGIGGTDPGAANVIASNGDDGVRIVDTASLSATENAILGNSITGNTGLGIDLGGDGVTANDNLDVDLGPNGRQNFPEVDIALSGGGTTWVTGTLHSESETTYRIEVFADPNGEGRDFIGSTVVTTDGSHNAAFSITAPVSTDPGLEVAATATELVGGTPGSTSEFSAPFIVPPCDDTAPDGGGTVIGGPADDILCGSDGDDVFVGGGGNDFVFGGDGDDTLQYSGAAGSITANLGVDRVTDDGDGGADFVFDVENVTGTAFDDTIVGDGGPNLLDGLEGDDVLVGGAGADTLLGGGGQDDLRGGAGHDTLRGQGGRDVLRGQGGRDRLLGGARADRLLGGAGRDVLRGQGGPDTLNGGAHVDRCLGGPGNDTFVNCEL